MKELKTRVPAEIPLRARDKTNNKPSQHIELTLGFEPGPHWWEASTLTTVPPALRPKSASGHSQDTETGAGHLLE